MAKPMQSVDPTLLALQTAKTASQNAKKIVPASLSTQAIAKPSLNVQTQQPQAIFTPPTAKVGGISSPFGATNINSTPILGGATPTEIGTRATQLQSLPKAMPKTGSNDNQKYIDLQIDIKKGMPFEKMKELYNDIPESAQSDLYNDLKRGMPIEKIPELYPELQGGGQKSNKVMDFLSQAAQPFKTVGEGLAGLATKAGDYLDPDTYNPVLQAVNTARMGAGLVDGTAIPNSEAENRYMDKSVSQNVLDTAEGTTYLASQIYAPITSAVFQLGAEIPGVRNVLGALGEGFTRVGEKLKYVPGYKQYRDSLPPEDQQRLDAFAGNMIATFAGTTGKKNLTQGKLKDYVIENFGSPGDIDRAFGKQIKAGAEATIAGTKTLYNKIPNPIESIARKITGTADDYGKLFKSAEPRTNQLNKAVDYKNLQKNHNIASEEIVKAGYKPVDTASRAEAHANTMKKIRKEEIESKIGNNFRINLNPVADKIDEFVSKQKTAGLLKNEGQLAELKAQADKFRKMGEVDGADGEFIKEMLNSQADNRGDASLGDVYKNGLKEAAKTLGQSLDDTFSSIPGQFSEAKRRFGALKATYQDIVKADIKAQKAKGLGIGETFGRIEGIGDIVGAIGGLVTGKNPLPQLASGFGKLAVGKVLAKIKDKDFLIQEGFEGLSKKIPVANTINISKKGTQLGLPLLKQTAKAPTAITPGGVIKQTPVTPKPTPKTPPITVEKGAIGMGTPKPKSTAVLPPKPTVAPSVGEVKTNSNGVVSNENKKILTDYLEKHEKARNNYIKSVYETYDGDIAKSYIKERDNKYGPKATQARDILGIKRTKKSSSDVQAENFFKGLQKEQGKTPPAPKGFKGLGKETMEQNITKVDDSLVQEAKKYKSAEEYIGGLEKEGKVLYHGTDADIDSFSNDFIGKGGDSQRREGAGLGKGIYLTNKLDEAKFYAKLVNEQNTNTRKRNDMGKHQENIMSQLKEGKITKAQAGDMFFNGPETAVGKENIIKTVIDGKLASKKDIKEIFGDNLPRKYIDDGFGKRFQIIDQEKINKLLKDKGFIGRSEPYTMAGQQLGGREMSDNIVIFDPAYIKTESQLKQIREQANKKPLPPLPKKPIPKLGKEIMGRDVSTKKPINKIQSFVTDEGKFSTYDTEKIVPRNRTDMFTVFEDKNGWIVRNALVPEDMRGKGIATEFYKKMNTESLKKTKKPLRSTQERVLINGERVHELSKDGIALWDSLVKKGLAKKLGEKNYVFINQ